MLTIHQVIPKLHEAEGGLHPVSFAMRGVMPATLQWYYDHKGIGKQVPFNSGQLGNYMKSNVTKSVSTEIADIKYFKPNGLHTLAYKEVASLLLGIVYHLPSLANSVVGAALTRLGEPKAIYRDVEKKVRKRQIRLDQTWLSELNAYSLRAGAVPVYNAVHDSIKELYLERNDHDDIKNRLERVWARMDECTEEAAFTGPIANNQPGGLQVPSTDTDTGLFGGAGIVINDHAINTCSPYERGRLSFSEKAKSKWDGFIRDLFGIQYTDRDWGAFARSVFILSIFLLGATALFLFTRRRFSF